MLSVSDLQEMPMTNGFLLGQFSGTWNGFMCVCVTGNLWVNGIPLEYVYECSK